MTQQYDDIPAVRRSDLWEIRKSPAHYLYKVTHPEEPTATLLFGTAAHKYILEPESFWDEYIEVPKIDRRTKAGKEEWQRILDSGKTPISSEDLAVIRDMNAQIEAHPLASSLLKTGQHEIPIEWTDAKTGEPCKCRPDVITTIDGENWIADYKTTTSCMDGAFEKACRAYGYKLQAAMYAEGVFCSTFDLCKFAFVAQEKMPPYAVRVYKCDMGFILEGQEMFHELIGILHECKETGEWPGYEDKELIGDE